MIINESKGSLGFFSFAGRASAEYHKVFVNNTQLYTKKKPQDQKTNNEEGKTEQEIDDIFDIDFAKNKGQNEPIKDSPTKTITTASDNYKFHNQHKNTQKKPEKKPYPSCTYYNPKKSFIMKRLLTGPTWKSQTQRKLFTKTDNTRYYLNREDLTANKSGKTLLDMSKMTMRGDFINSKDVRIKNIKALTKANSTNKFNLNNDEIGLNDQIMISSEKESSAQSRPLSSLSIDKKNKTCLISKSALANPRPRTSSIPINKKQTESQINDKREMNVTKSSKDSYDEYRYIYLKQLKHLSLSAKKTTKKPLVKGPDFKRALTRKHLDKLNDKKALIPFSLPNFNQVRERPVMMVSYEFNSHKNKKKRSLTTVDSSPYLNPYKYINKINNHQGISTPNFKLMKPRPSSSDHPLPLFMNKIYNRLAGNETTDLSLKLNNYTEGFYREQQSAFFPKKTFNKIINLSLLNSSQLQPNLKYKQSNVGNNTAKAMKFYRKPYDYYQLSLEKNYDDLIKESMLTKFDGITLKSHSKHNKYNMKEIEAFLLNYEIKKIDNDDEA